LDEAAAPQVSFLQREMMARFLVHGDDAGRLGKNHGGQKQERGEAKKSG
jgi:hypothetical protein